MKKAELNSPTLSNSNGKDAENDLIVQFIGEFLHSDTLTVQQLNEGYLIRNAEKVVKQLIDAGTIEELPGKNPKEYQFKVGIPKWFNQDETQPSL